jgi:large conductance mechanosensitive channel
MLKEFADFLKKFNVLPVAIAFILAGAFAPVVQATVDLILEVIAKLLGSKDPAESLADLSVADIHYGNLLAVAFSFVMIAFIVFLIAKALNKSGMKTEEDSAPTADQQLLTEIRDLLRSGR